MALLSHEKIIQQVEKSLKKKIFYKHDFFPDEVWINKEILIQLNITSKCPVNCSFCYVKHKYNNKELGFEEVIHFFKNLEKYHREYNIVYNINLTGGDIFSYYKIEELLRFLKATKYVKEINPLINRIWNERTKKLLLMIKEKIGLIQMNIFLVKDEDISFALKLKKPIAIKYAIYRGSEKKLLEKSIDLMKKYEKVYLGFDWIIPQYKEYAKYCYLKNIKNGIREVRKVIEKLRNEGLENRILTTSCIIQREIFNKIYLCGIGFQNICVMPDEKIAICPRFPFLDTGFTIENFDLVEYLSKYQKLISNTCLFENKYFTNFWKKEENPRFW